MKKILILLSFCVFLLISCGNKAQNEIRKNFDDMMKIITTGDFEKVKKISPNLTQEQFSIVEEGFKKIKYEIKNVEVKDEKAKLTVLVNYPNTSNLLTEYMLNLNTKANELQNLSDESAKNEMINFTKNFFAQKFKENKVNFEKEEMTINYIKKDEKWVLNENENKDLKKLFSLGVVK